MKIFTIFVAFIFAVLLIAGAQIITSSASAQDGKKMPDTITLGAESKLGSVVFHHADHVTKNRSLDGTKPIACVECHHTAQPMAEAVKHPPHKTVWPADRTTTLTADLFEKDPNAPVVNDCRDCHARADTKPKLIPEIPQIKNESGEPVVLTNQQAFHRNCTSCHDAVLKARPDATAPGSKKCTACHKRAAATS